jgi:hypothetical protein
MGLPAAVTHPPRESGPDAELWDEFSLMHGGPLRRGVWALGIPRSARGYVCFGIATALVAWVPLLILTAASGTLTSGSAIPFLSSIGTHVRLLLAIPLLVLAEEIFDQSVRKAIRAIVRSELVPPGQLPRLRQALLEAVWWRDAWFIELGLAVVAVAFITGGVRTDLPGDLTTWRTTAEGQRTLAAWWYGTVGLLWFQFLIWRSIVRLLIWSRLLWRIRGLDLQLVPTHPDLCAGLGPLAWPHVSLAPYSFALSSILVATFAEQVMQGRDVRDAVMPTVVVVVTSTFALVAPLLLFAPKLIQTKLRGERDYGVLAASYTRAFDEKWVHNQSSEGEPLLGTADIQSLADLANAFEVIDQMRLVPISRRQLLQLAAAAAAPAMPLVLFVIPLDELIVRGAQIIFPL